MNPSSSIVAPTAVTVKAGDKCATVSFTPSVSTGVTRYTVTSTPDGIVATGTSSPIVVSNLVNGTSYTFSVTATNGTVVSPASTASPSIKVGAQNGGIRAVFYIFLALVLIGALNWGLVSINEDYDLVAMIFGDYTMPSRVVYGLVGLSALIVIILAGAQNSAIYATN
jgi:uncharacterized membrane protein YuzA (DUF378 family)